MAWSLNTPTQCIFVALDISGFSRIQNFQVLQSHRGRFTTCIDQTPLYPRAAVSQSVVPQWLGDELRLAFEFAAPVSPRDVRDFIDHVFDCLAGQNGLANGGPQTRIRGAVIIGQIVMRSLLSARDLEGVIAFRAADWLEEIAADEVVACPGFTAALQADGVDTTTFSAATMSDGTTVTRLR